MFLSSLLLALRAIRRNLLRSFLTILGIVIGVSAVITMVTLGNGATRVVAGEGIGRRPARHEPGQSATNPAPARSPAPGRPPAGPAIGCVSHLTTQFVI